MSGRRCLQDNPSAPSAPRASGPRCSRGAFTSRCSARAAATTTRCVAATRARCRRGCALPVVATHPVQFLRPEDFSAHEARVCIAEGYVLADQRRPKRFTPEQYFKTQAEMARLFADLPEALANTVEIAQRCSCRLALGKSRLPRFPDARGSRSTTICAREAAAGLERAWRCCIRTPRSATARARVLRRAPRVRDSRPSSRWAFPGYFLIVADFINWAKKNGVPVGPGRGSGAGSLVAYRWASPTSIPCATTCCSSASSIPSGCRCPTSTSTSARTAATASSTTCKQKYGADSVSQIATFGTMAAKAVVRDVGRVLDLPYSFVDSSPS